MNKKIYIISFIFLGFILNIFFYVISDNYRYFLQSLKNKDNTYNINDDFEIKLNNLVPQDISSEDNEEESIFSGLKNNFWEDSDDIYHKQNNTKSNKKQPVAISKPKIHTADIKQQVEFAKESSNTINTNIEKNILKQFKKYKLKPLELQWRIFWLTSEYPYKYLEYYNDDLNLYLFWNKNYNELKDIFSVLWYELPIKINEVNNFWHKSFYINLNDLFDDSYVRIVIQSQSRMFGIKIKKDFYTKHKNDLGQIFHK